MIQKSKQNTEQEESDDYTDAFYKKIIKTAGIPKKLKDKTFNNYESTVTYEGEEYNFTAKLKHLKKFAKGEMEDVNFVYLAGNVGNGKSHLAVATAKTLAYQLAKEFNQSTDFITTFNLQLPQDKYQFLYVNWRSKIKKIRNSYSNYNSDGEKMIEEMELAEILVIDDLFARSKPSSSDLDDIFDLLNYRYEQDKTTIITSNESPDDFLMNLQPKDLKDYRKNPLKQSQLDLITERIASRILEACGGVILEFDAPNYRFKKVSV